MVDDPSGFTVHATHSVLVGGPELAGGGAAPWDGGGGVCVGGGLPAPGGPSAAAGGGVPAPRPRPRKRSRIAKTDAASCAENAAQPAKASRARAPGASRFLAGALLAAQRLVGGTEGLDASSSRSKVAVSAAAAAADGDGDGDPEVSARGSSASLGGSSSATGPRGGPGASSGPVLATPVITTSSCEESASPSGPPAALFEAPPSPPPIHVYSYTGLLSPPCAVNELGGPACDVPLEELLGDAAFLDSMLDVLVPQPSV